MIKPNLRTNDLRSAIKLQSEKVLDTTSLVNKSSSIWCGHGHIMQSSSNNGSSRNFFSR